MPDKIKAQFLHPALQRIKGEPDYAVISTIMLQLYENAAVIPTSLGGGAHGYIGLVMDPILYSMISTTAYMTPTAPTSATMPNNASSQAKYDEDNCYKKELDTYENNVAMDDVLKKQIQEVLDDVYICQICNKHSVYLGETTRDILNHLMDRYGKMKPADLVANGTQCNEQMDISQPIDAYFAHIDNCIQYTADEKRHILPNKS
eukprot:7569061-Ditylum_brightwellii.AAC.2